ncbi:MAG: hypothetical protein U0271_29795 [Polyangiaceae bacterium]
MKKTMSLVALGAALAGCDGTPAARPDLRARPTDDTTSTLPGLTATSRATSCPSALAPPNSQKVSKVKVKSFKAEPYGIEFVLEPLNPPSGAVTARAYGDVVPFLLDAFRNATPIEVALDQSGCTPSVAFVRSP